MIHRRWVPVVVAILAAGAWAWGDQPATRPTTQPIVPDTFMRFVDDGHGGGSFQTADLTLRNSAGATVHLIAAVHIGEKGYYEKLNNDFKTYDAVLYELVMSKDVDPPAPGEAATRPANGIGEFQRFLKDSLELDFQLDDIDYTAPNFIHADLDKETFEKMQADRGESFETLMLQQLLNALANPPSDDQSDQSMEDMIHVLTRPDMERQLKVLIARQLGDMDSTAMGLDGPGGTVILTERNKAALKVLADTLADGKKNVAIFYGAAHLPDMTKHLLAQGFVPVSIHWNMAWDLAIRPDQPSAVEKLLDGLFGDDKK